MIIRPGPADVRLIGYHLGQIILGLGLAMMIPAIVALFLREWNSFTALIIGASLSTLVGSVTEMRLFTRRPLDWSHAMVAVALAWLLGAVFVAIPLYLSGHFPDFLDALFDGMSGLTTTGLTVLSDLDHLSRSMNLFRHLVQFAGGQGIVVVVLSLFAAGGGRAGTLYVSEAREERILPNVIRTARFIYTVASVYLLFGTLSIWAAIWNAGVPAGRALWHAVNLFFSAFDTGGFSPYSTSINYYHSSLVELVLLVVMFAGALSFGLHFQLWQGNRQELVKNIETRTLAISMTVLVLLTFFGLARSEAFMGADALFRKGFFTIASAHANVGFMVNSGRMFVSDWGTLAPAAVVGAMALGGMASSTAGGIKALRVGLAAKGLLGDIKRVLLPESALVVQTYHSRRRQILRDDLVRSATTVLLLYILTYLAGAIVGLAYGTWDITETLFESVAAASNAGLNVGISSSEMPRGLQVTYILQMWLGRLEFMAGFALLGYFIAFVRGRT